MDPRFGLTLASSLLLTFSLCGPARADAKKNRVALDHLAEVYAPIGAKTGAARIDAACAAAAALQAAVGGLDDEHAPAGAIVGDDDWAKVARAVESDMMPLGDDCKAPGRKRTVLGGQVETAEQTVASLDADMHTLLELVKPRKLAPAMKTFQATLAKTKFPSGSFCKRAKDLGKQVGGLATAPAGADAGAWQKAYDAVKAGVAAIACTKGAADEELAGSFNDLQDHFTALLLLVPAS